MKPTFTNKKTFFIFILCLLSFSVFSQNDSTTTEKPCACCTQNHQQFDFWVGDWTVYDTTGTEVGKNTIIKLEDDCILNEHWRGASGTTGRSYNYFNKADSTWNQVWLDNSGGNLILKGNLKKEGIMVMRSELLQGQKGKYYHQITWTKNEDDSVTQRWDIQNEKHETISLAFLGIYKKE